MKTRCILPCVVLCPIDTSDFTLDFFRLVSLFELRCPIVAATIGSMASSVAWDC